jgi:serine protease Do
MRSSGLQRGRISLPSGMAAAAALLCIAAAAAGCAPSAGPSSGPVRMTSFAPLVQEVMPAVVNVAAVQKPRRAAVRSSPTDELDPAAERPSAGLSASALEELLRKFFEEQERQSAPHLRGLALGSGFIVDPRGYIVTDDHVLENADSVAVTFHDGSQHLAQIIGRDALTDVALIKIESPRPLPYVHWGDSDAVRVGDWVLAIGNPFGLDNSVSSGIISARGRDIHSGPYDDFLQIDASINRGNSGGPTFDLNGDVIGINSAIYSPNGGSVGIGFAIPANLARPVVEQLLAHGRVARGWLGVQIQPVTAEIAQGFGLAAPQGALVTGVSPAGPAARAGFTQGDVILSVNGRAVERMRELPLIIADTPIGRPAEVTIWRRNREVSLQPVIGQMPDEPQTAELAEPQTAPLSMPPAEITAGLKLAPVTAHVRRRLELPPDVGGAVVAAIGNDSPFAAADLLPGDVIEMIDQEPVASPADAYAKLRAAASGSTRTVLVLVNRHGSNRYLALSLAGPISPDGPG